MCFMLSEPFSNTLKLKALLECFSNFLKLEAPCWRCGLWVLLTGHGVDAETCVGSLYIVQVGRTHLEVRGCIKQHRQRMSDHTHRCQALRGTGHVQGNGGTPKAAGNQGQGSWPFPQFPSGNSFGAAQSFLPQQPSGAPAQQQVGHAGSFCSSTSLPVCQTMTSVPRARELFATLRKVLAMKGGLVQMTQLAAWKFAQSGACFQEPV